MIVNQKTISVIGVAQDEIVDRDTIYLVTQT